MEESRLNRLTERQKQCLRLVAGGDEVKEIARKLDIGTDAVSERLRAARRILDVSTSREAARVLLAHEDGAYRRSVTMPQELGGAAGDGATGSPQPEGHRDSHNRLRDETAAFAPAILRRNRRFPWPLRSTEHAENDLTTIERLGIIGTITVLYTTGLSLAVIAVVLMMRFLIYVSRNG